MIELYYPENEHALIPSELLKASQDFKGFEGIHLAYWVRYGGQSGLCTYRQAFEFLSDDLREHGLPVRYSNFASFKVQKTKNNK